MRKITFFWFSLLALLTSTMMANAQETKSPYKVDFNSAIATDDHAFLVDVGWEHLVGDVDGRYVSYTYKATGGYNNSGYLSVGTQKLKDAYGDEQEAFDWLVTPAITGASSLYVKKEKTFDCYLKIYKLKKVNGKYIADGAAIYSSADDADFKAATDWYEVGLQEGNGTRFGIYASYVGLDDFEAESAKIELKKELAITSSNTIGTYTNADADGNYTFDFNVTVKNTGGVTLNPGDAGYQVDIKNADGTVVKTIAIDKTLAAGESYTIPVSVTLNMSEYPDASYYYAYEGISDTKTTIAKVTPVAYNPIMKVVYGSKEVADDFVLNFGSIKTAKTEEFTISNDGGKELVVSKLAASDGFTVDATAPLTVQPHESAKVKVTMDVATVGAKTGTLEIESDGGNKTVNLKGMVIDANTWYEDFEGGKLPAGMVIVGKSNVWAVSNCPSGVKTEDNKYVLKASDTNAATVVSPLLDIEDGEELSLDMARLYSTKGNLIVKYSTDRENWTVVKEFNVDDFSADKSGYDYKFSAVSVGGIPAGKHYVGFESNGCYIDNIAGFKLADVAHDWKLLSVNVSGKGEVNSTLNVSATLQNNNVKDEVKDGYTATLYIGGMEVATAEALAIAGGETHTFNFAYTPHEAGTIKAYVEFAADDYKVASNEVDITIGEELAVGEVQIETPAKRASSAPVATYYNDSESKFLYPASKLESLMKGDKIAKVSFKGYVEADITKHLKVWIANVDVETLEKPVASLPTEGMALVYDGDYVFKKNGKETNSLADDAAILEIGLDEPFVYEGKGIAMAVSSSSSTYARTYFQVVKNDESLAYYRKADSDLSSKSFYSTELPVACFSLLQESVMVEGSVIDSETSKPIANADVKLVSGDVEYYGKTDENGSYSVNVIKSNLAYKAEISAEGYTTLSDADVDLTAANNFKLVSNTPTGISEVVTSDAVANAKVYNAQGILVSKSGLSGLKPGLYIVNGKKVIKK